MSLRRFGFASCLCVTTVLLGCAADDRGAEPPEGSVQAALTEDGAEQARGRRGPGGGPELLLHAALRELDLSEAQETSIRASLESLHARREQGGLPHGALFRGLASEVRAGNIDVAAVMAKADGGEAAMAAHHTEVASALQELHAALDAGQRRELVDAIQARVAEAKSDHDGPGRAAASEDGPRRKQKGQAGGPRAGGPAGFLFAELDLDDEQQAALDAALASARPDAPPDRAGQDGKAMREAMTARLQTFASDAFDARSFVTPPAGAAPGMRGHVEALVKVVATMTPELDATQREKLALRLEQGPPRVGASKRGH